MLSQVAYKPSTIGDGTTPRPIPPPTPIKFPRLTPQTTEGPPSERATVPLVPLIQSIHRPADVHLSIFDAVGLHVVPDAAAQDILPEACFLPPDAEWLAAHAEDVGDTSNAFNKSLNNGRKSPGVQTYLERAKELSVDNTAAFRTIRRIPPPTGEPSVRLGNAYEFFKNLEFFSSFWDDTSLPPKADTPAETPLSTTPYHLLVQNRSGSGAQLPPEYRQHLVTAFVKLVAYDFGCNVAYPRFEPRLHINPSPSSKSVLPASYFPAALTMVYRTPSDRASARVGVVEGPLAVISCRATTNFTTEAEARIDLAREVSSVLLTAQQRAREHTTEVRFGTGKWWCESKRWGGGPGGPIGKESELPAGAVAAKKDDRDEMKKAIGGINGPSPSKRSKKDTAGGNLQIYDNYRKMLPPSSTWDRKARYQAIGKPKGQNSDDVFLVSSLNHHVSILRVRVPLALLDELGGTGNEGEGRERVVMWRSRWYDLFQKDDRIEAMGIIWGMMAWLMREVSDEAVGDEKGPH